MRTDILEQVKARIRQAPNNFFMHSWVVPDAVEGKIDGGYCGTTMCIGGWGMFELGMSHEELYQRTCDTADPQELITGYDMMDSLGLPNTRLFYIYEWPAEFRDMYEDAEDEENPDLNLLSEIACNAIDSYIETNGWPDGFDDDEPDYWNREPNW
jgi:hypothetical protein